jgi:hypothetical protein
MLPTTKEQIEDFHQRVAGIMEEARGFGFATVFGIVGYDPFADSEQFIYDGRGPKMYQKGLADAVARCVDECALDFIPEAGVIVDGPEDGDGVAD